MKEMFPDDAGDRRPLPVVTSTHTRQLDFVCHETFFLLPCKIHQLVIIQPIPFVSLLWVVLLQPLPNLLLISDTGVKDEAEP